MKEFFERGLGDIYEQIEKNYKKEIDNVKIKDENYYNNLYQFYTERIKKIYQ